MDLFIFLVTVLFYRDYLNLTLALQMHTFNKETKTREKKHLIDNSV